MMKNAARILMVVALFLMVAVVVMLVLYSSGDTKYYEYRDLAVVACKDGDMKGALEYIQTAIQYAEDLDSVSEGLHYKMLFEHKTCDE